MNVDVHVHFCPPEHLAALHRHGATVSTAGGATELGLGSRRLRLTEPFTELEALLGLLAGRRIDLAVLSVLPPTFGYRLLAADAEALARAANTGLASASAASGGRADWLATVPLQAPAAAGAVLRDALEAGAAGALIGTNVAGAPLEAAPLRPFLATAAELGALLLVHAEDVLAPERLDRHYLSNLAGNPYEAGLALASAIFGGVLDDLPGLRLAFCHAGGAAPALAGRWDRAHATGRLGGTRLPQPPSSYFRRVWFDTLCYSEPALRLLAGLCGPERLLLGSDAPFPLADPDPVGSVEAAAWLDGTARAAVLGGNALSLVKSGGPL